MNQTNPTPDPFRHPAPPASLPLRPDLLDAGGFRALLRRTTLTLLVALLVPMAVLGGVVYLLRHSAHLVDHSDRVIAEANYAEKLLVTMQSGFRGYRLMRDPVVLTTYYDAREEIGPHLFDVERLVSDSPSQTALARGLRDDSVRWIEYADTSLKLFAAGKTEAEQRPELQAARATLLRAVASAHALLVEEERLRTERNLRLDRVFSAFVALLVIAVAFGIPWLAFWLLRLLHRLNHSYRANLTEAERRATELRVTLHSIGDAVIATDAQGRVDFLNPAAEALTGWSSLEARDQPLATVFAIFNEDTGAVAPSPVERVIRENIVVGLANHTVLRSRHGRDYPIEDSAAPIRDDAGRVRGVILVFHDVSDKRVIERRMEESAERFRILSGIVALQVWTATPAGELDYANHECVNYFGADLEREILGQKWAQFVHPEDLARTASAWQVALETGQRYELEFRLRNTGGMYRWFLVRAEPARDGTGRITKWFGTNTDIDLLKRAQNLAELASRTKDDFLAALSHELRTPLTPVLLTATALREDTRLPADVRHQLGMMERNIALEARLIDDLLDLTAISRGKLQLRRQPGEAHALIDLALEIVQADARAKDITLERQFAATRPGIEVDPARFQQVIWNVLRNAVKFTPVGGRVVISTREEKRGDIFWLCIEISDSGIGIEPGALQQIFLPFDQGGLPGSHRFGGLGLGLAIARGVVDLHGGRITAHSDGTNQGSRFVIELPNAGDPPQDTEPAPTAQTPVPASRPLRLLLVEDHENTIQTLQMLLQRAGHQVVPARSIADALAAATQGKFDLAVSDLGLPDGTGNDLMECLRQTYGLRGIALSGYGTEEDIARSKQAGFVAHLVKPVVFADLQRAIAAANPAT